MPKKCGFHWSLIEIRKGRFGFRKIWKTFTSNLKFCEFLRPLKFKSVTFQILKQYIFKYLEMIKTNLYIRLQLHLVYI